MQNFLNYINNSQRGQSVQPSEEKQLLKAIAENPDQKLSLTVTQFMSDFLAKKEASKRVDTPLLNNRKAEGASLKKTQVELLPIDNPLSTSNLSQIEKSKISQESQPQIPLTPNLYQLQNSNLSIPQIQQQQMYYGNQYYMNSFPNSYMNYTPINQAYPNYYQYPLSSGFQQYPGYF
ncbi:unnamed protein product [Paramecium octaurelia]|uniref:Uncharacterized protein n=1 Tax=Paramecium octaurelia TaxID=43137 RepID=A0A8S1WB91_PAROT|nr:unnamed protein product [Paramecium octaurelia]